ncbi:F-box family protein [Euphorbia peplus]|nr:F-box family protein [Euphorbia peplus]
MERYIDFFNWLDYDTSLKVLMCLEDPSDLVRVSSVSRSWRHFVIANALCKQLCFRMFPCLYKVDHVIESSCGTEDSLQVGSSKSVEWENLKREHRAYAFLAHSSSSAPLRPCILSAISASSTDNYPEESIHNTLEPRDIVQRGASYWSSKGHKNPAVPETLTYKLIADICVVTEISVQPFRAFFQWDSPIYSSKAVRFRMGHPKTPMDFPIGELCDNCDNDNFIWTYTSPEFPMAQEKCLQTFELPEPALCMGGIFQVELLGRMQTQEMDGLFYICVSHVKVIGRPLSGAFSAGLLESSSSDIISR